MVTDPKSLADVLSLAKFFPGMEKREEDLRVSIVSTKDGIKISRKCIMHTLAALREAGEETAFDFAWLINNTPPQKVPNIRFAPLSNSETALLLERVFVEEEYQENPIAMITTERYRALERLYDVLQYKRGNSVWDENIHAIIDEGLELTTDNAFIFNEARLLILLDPIDRNAIVMQSRSNVPVPARTY